MRLALEMIVMVTGGTEQGDRKQRASRRAGVRGGDEWHEVWLKKSRAKKKGEKIRARLNVRGKVYRGPLELFEIPC